MESTQVIVDLEPPRPHPAGDAAEQRCGRFSYGSELLPDSETKHHVGRFADGIAAPVNGGGMPLGRFSAGIERDPAASSVVRHGSFADGYELVGRS